MMNKTKVRVSPFLHDYCQEMAQRVNDARDEKLRIAARMKINLEPCTEQMDMPVFETAGLLMPPRIETLLPTFYWQGGKIESIIHMITSDFFGIVDLHVTLRDEAGNLLERGPAMRDPIYLGYWAYLPRLVPAAGTTVIVRAVAADALGGVSIAQETVTLTDEFLLENSVDLAEWQDTDETL